MWISHVGAVSLSLKRLTEDLLVHSSQHHIDHSMPDLRQARRSCCDDLSDLDTRLGELERKEQAIVQKYTGLLASLLFCALKIFTIHDFR